MNSVRCSLFNVIIGFMRKLIPEQEERAIQALNKETLAGTFIWDGGRSPDSTDERKKQLNWWAQGVMHGEPLLKPLIELHAQIPKSNIHVRLVPVDTTSYFEEEEVPANDFNAVNIEFYTYADMNGNRREVPGAIVPGWEGNFRTGYLLVHRDHLLLYDAAARQYCGPELQNIVEELFEHSIWQANEALAQSAAVTKAENELDDFLKQL